MASRRSIDGSVDSCEIVIIGASLGGLDALKVLLGALSMSFHLPIVVVQHRSKDSDGTLTAILQRACVLPVSEANDKEPIVPGRLYLAPADYHLLVERGWFALCTSAPVHYARPSIDALFESAAEAYGASVVGIILTGTTEDGAAGAARVMARGGTMVAQDPATAEAPTMPAAAIAAANIKYILSLQEIALLLKRLATNDLGRPSKYAG